MVNQMYFSSQSKAVVHVDCFASVWVESRDFFARSVCSRSGA